jgi:hypothetical protein
VGEAVEMYLIVLFQAAMRLYGEEEVTAPLTELLDQLVEGTGLEE